jgi:DNA primase
MADFELDRDVIARVREAVDAVELVSDHVRLRRRGRTWEGLCPFHDEKTPSFSVDPEKGLYFCFGCGAGGDVFKLVMELENLSFPEAVEMLARRYGVPLPPRSPGARRRREEGEKLRSILEEAQHWFVERLAAADAAPARAELERRGFAPHTWSDFGFGWAPDDWRCLLGAMRRRHPEGVLVNAGLAVQPEAGRSPYDRFRNRLMFPIRGRDGGLIAFGGRVMGDGEPKYLNSPESPVFSKRATLFCLDRARLSISRGAEAIVVEGYFDCLSLQREGIANAVATLGTSLTPEHARVLRRLLGADGRVLVCFDADAAGRRAASGAAQVLLEAGVEVAVVTLREGKDPDDVIRDLGIEAFRQMMATPTPLLEFLLEDLPADPAERRRAGLGLAPLVCSASDPAVRQNLIEELARRLNLRARDVEERGRQPGSRRGAGEPAGSGLRRPPLPPGERDLARLLLAGPVAIRGRARSEIDPELLVDQRVRSLVRLAGAIADETDLAAHVMSACEDEPTRSLVAELCARGLPDPDEKAAGTTFRVILERQRRERARALQEAIERASADGDLERLAALQAEKVELRRHRE